MTPRKINQGFDIDRDQKIQFEKSLCKRTQPIKQKKK